VLFVKFPSLLALVSALSFAALAFSQSEKTQWKEYVFASDGFALTLPYAPKPHPDANLADATVYTIDLPNADDGTVTLRVLHQPRDCLATLGQLKEGALTGRAPGADASSVKDVFIDGHPGMEYQWKVSPARVVLERHYCIDGRFYTFSTAWPSAYPLPAAATRIMKSFRLVKPDSHR